MSKRLLIRALIIVAILAVGTFIWFTQTTFQKTVTSLRKISIATIPFSYTGYSVYVAIENGYFKDNGLDVTLTSYSTGKATLNAVIEEEAEFGVSSETPFMHAVLDGAEIYACASMITAEKHLGIVARKDKGITKAEDLAGKKIGVTPGTNSEYFLDTVLLMHGMSRDSIKTVNIKPKQMFDALMSSEVDAIATWNPQMFRANKELGGEGTTIYSEGMYSPWFIIAARKDYVKSNQDVVEKVLHSLLSASDFIRNNHVESNEIVALYLNMDETLLNELSAVYYFSISLEQSFILSLEHQTQWAIDNKLTDQVLIPNYVDYIYTEGLESVRPGAVTIIR